jgi:hypothetical protein
LKLSWFKPKVVWTIFFLTLISSSSLHISGRLPPEYDIPNVTLFILEEKSPKAKKSWAQIRE